MNQTSDDKTAQDADRESRIAAFLEALPDDLEMDELECVLLAIICAYIEEVNLPNFLMYLGLKTKILEDAARERQNSTTH